jgi:two-component system OmpR family sensor kinase
MKKFRLPISIAPPGIRLQMTLWYTIVSALLMLLFGITFYLSTQNLLASSFDTTLRLRSQQVAEGVSIHGGKIHVENIVHELPELDSSVALMGSSEKTYNIPTSNNDLDQHTAPPPATGGNVLVQVLDMNSQVLYRTLPFKRLKTPAESIASPLHGNPWYGTVLDSNQQPIRLYSTMLVDEGRTVGIVQVGQSLAKVNMTLQNILLALLVLTPFILALCGLGSYWLAGRAFMPIHRLTHTAREIGVKDLHRRVPVPIARDEVRDLSIIFNDMIGRLEHSFAQQRRFVSDASHELRTPVAVIRNITEVTLAQPSTREDYQSVLQEINVESERLGRLINDLLAVARTDEGQIKLDVELVRLDLLAIDVMESLEPLATERDIMLRINKLTPALVLGDAARLIQIIMNLVDNALSYTNPGGMVTISVETCATHIHLSVQDTGIGIAQKDIGHIFERFYRADLARSKAVGGSGLGLSILDWAVRAHNGVVTVESELKKGSTFVVTLPLAPPA